MDQFYTLKIDDTKEDIRAAIGADEDTLTNMFLECVKPELDGKVFNTAKAINNIWNYDKAGLPERILALYKLGRLVESKIQSQAMRGFMHKIVDDIAGM